MIYLDYAADTPVSQIVLSEFLLTAREYGANPNSLHALGLEAKRRFDQATEHIAQMLCAQPDEIIMTSGATEANNLAIFGVARAYQSRGRHLIASLMEHASVTGPMAALKAEGFDLDFMKVQLDGRVLKTLTCHDQIFRYAIQTALCMRLGHK